MVQIVQNPNLGEMIGTGLGEGLKFLAQNKLQQIQQRNQQRQTAQGLASLPGFTPEMAESLSFLPPELLNQVVKSQLAAPGEQAYAQALSQLLGSGEQQMQQPGQQMMAQQTEAPGVVLPRGLNAKQATELAKLGLHKQELQQKISAKEQQEIQKATQPYYESTLAKAEVAKDSEKRLNRMLELVDKGKLPHAGFYNVLKNLEEHPGTTAGAGAATGAAAGAALGSVVPGLGTTLGGLIGGALGGFVGPVASLVRSSIKGTSPDIEEFEKLSADFIKDAKAIFSSRITDADLRAFLQMIPTLSNTDEGKRVIIRNLKNFNKASEIKAKAMKEIIKENGGRRPINLQELVDERSEKELDKLARDFVTGV